MTDERVLDRKWLVLAAVGTSILLTTIDGTIVNVALPTLERELETDFARVQWVSLAYLLTLSSLLIGMGRMGDMYGPKPVFMAGLVIFTAGSVLCGLAPSIEWLIGFRVLQAIGAAINQALGIAIITACFPASERGKALGISGTLACVGIVLGPALGGVIIESLSWRWIFFVNLPIGIAGLALAWRHIRHDPPRRVERFDGTGAGVLFVALLSLLTALTLTQHRGFDDGLVVSAPIAGALSDRYGTRVIATLGLAVLAMGYLAMSRLDADTPSWAYVLAVLPFGVGMGVFQSPNSSAVMGSVPPDRLGVASGLLAITRNFGQTAGIAVLTALWATRVADHAGYMAAGGATQALPGAQIAGLQDAFRWIALFVGAARLISLYSVWRACRSDPGSPGSCSPAEPDHGAGSRLKPPSAGRGD